LLLAQLWDEPPNDCPSVALFVTGQLVIKCDSSLSKSSDSLVVFGELYLRLAVCAPEIQTQALQEMASADRDCGGHFSDIPSGEVPLELVHTNPF
jgi:hypothetical protein